MDADIKNIWCKNPGHLPFGFLAQLWLVNKKLRKIPGLRGIGLKRCIGRNASGLYPNIGNPKAMVQKYSWFRQDKRTKVISKSNKNHFFGTLAGMSLAGIYPIYDFDFGSGKLLEGLTEQESAILFGNSTRQLYRKGDIIFKEGNFATGIYLVERGLVKKFKTDAMGVEQIFYLYGAGEIFGYHALLNNRGQIDSTVAIMDTRVVFIPGSDFLVLLQNSTGFSRKLLSVLSHEFEVLTKIFTLFNQCPLRERLIVILINLREKFKPPDFREGDRVTIHVLRADLASMLGTARESVVRLLGDLKAMGLVETRGGRIEIKDVKGLLGLVQL